MTAMPKKENEKTNPLLYQHPHAAKYPKGSYIFNKKKLFKDKYHTLKAGFTF